MDGTTAARHERRATLHLLLTQGPLSRLRLEQATRLEPQKLSRILEEFASLGLLREILPSSLAGRQEEPLLEISPTAAWSAGLFFHGTGMRLCLVNSASQIIAQKAFPSPIALEDLPSTIHSLLTEYAARLELPWATYTGLGVSIPGMVNPNNGTVSKEDWGWEHFPLQGYLEEQLGSPVAIERDVVCGAYGEKFAGRARTCDNFLYLLIHPRKPWDPGHPNRAYAYGVAIFLNGEVYRGTNFAAGEMKGALILDSMLVETNLDFPGENQVDRILHSFLTGLGESAGSLANLLDPEMIILCGEHRLLTPERLVIVEEAAREVMLNFEKRRFKLVNSSISMDGLSFGAALISLHRGLRKRLDSL